MAHGIDWAAATRMVDLARFYGVTSAVDTWLHALDHLERSEDGFRSSLVLVAGVALVGDDAQWRSAQAHYHYILSRPFVETRLQETLSAYSALIPRESAAATLARLRGIGASNATCTNVLPQVKELDEAVQWLSAMESRQKWLTMVDSAADVSVRLDSVVTAFLSADDVDGKVTARWNSVRWAEWRLLKEAQRTGAPIVCDALRRGLKRIPTRNDREEVLRRALHAIAFFGGFVFPSERDFVRRTDNDAEDLLLK